MFKALLYLLSVLGSPDVERIVKDAIKEKAQIYIIVPSTKETQGETRRDNVKCDDFEGIDEVDKTIDGIIKISEISRRRSNNDEKSAGESSPLVVRIQCSDSSDCSSEEESPLPAHEPTKRDITKYDDETNVDYEQRRLPITFSDEEAHLVEDERPVLPKDKDVSPSSQSLVN